MKATVNARVLLKTYELNLYILYSTRCLVVMAASEGWRLRVPCLLLFLDLRVSLRPANWIPEGQQEEGRGSNKFMVCVVGVGQSVVQTKYKLPSGLGRFQALAL